MENSPLNKLSAELRNEIYELVLAQDKPLVTCSEHPDSVSTAVQPPLTRVCRQIRAEALGLFYHCNTFVIEMITSEFWSFNDSCLWDFPYEAIWEDNGGYAVPSSEQYEILDRRTNEVSDWLKCTKQKHHDTIKKARVVFYTPCWHWDDQWESDPRYDWSPLLDSLRQFGYLGAEGRPKLKATVRVISDLETEVQVGHIYSQYLKDEARKYFEELGLDVEVTTWEKLWSPKSQQEEWVLNLPTSSQYHTTTALTIHTTVLACTRATANLFSDSWTPLATMENSLFGKLSAELRNDIYKRVLSADRSLAICSGPSELRKARQPPITRVCSQIREETLQMFYHCNTFVAEIQAHTHWIPNLDRWVLDKIDQIEHWLQCTTSKNFANVQDLRLVMTLPDYCYFEEEEAEWKALNQALKRLDLVGDGASPKMKVIACLRATSRNFQDFRERIKRETKVFFDSLGFEVEVVWEEMDGTWC